MRLRALVWAVGVLLAVNTAAVAQDATAPENSIDWTVGPAVVNLGTLAEVKVPANYRFTGKEGAKRVMELTHNLSSDELGVIVPPEGNWFITFDFNPIGYVKDDEKDRIDADGLIASMRSATEKGNAERERRGWGTMTIVGWEQPPRYDEGTHNLTWSIRGRGSEDVINHSVRLLGRGGVMQVDLVLAPDLQANAIPELDDILNGFSFKTGHKYAEFRTGDKVAAYGLTALIGGGLGAAAAKSGLLAKLWKAIVAGVIALIAAVRKLFGRDSAHRERPVAVPPPPRA